MLPCPNERTRRIAPPITVNRSVPRFCNLCGSARLAGRVPAGDDRRRDVCEDCGHIHYFNPKIVVGALPVWQDKVLLCRRAIAPRHGLWTLPAGFMEEGETLEEGAVRETREEADADIVIDSLYTATSLPDISQVYILFLARLTDGRFGCGSESLEVRLFEEADIPWDELAFRTVSLTLRHYFDDRRNGSMVPRTLMLRHAAPTSTTPDR